MEDWIVRRIALPNLWRRYRFIDFLNIFGDIHLYFGVKNFNMRIKAKNFEQHDLNKIAEFCHSQESPIKTYLTTNIIIGFSFITLC